MSERIGQTQLRVTHWDDPVGYHLLTRPYGTDPHTGREHEWESVADGLFADVVLAYIRLGLDLRAKLPRPNR